MSTSRRHRVYPPGTPERAVADAVAAVYADAAIRFDQLELDITRPEGAPHSREDAIAWRAKVEVERQAEAIRALGAGVLELGRQMGEVFATIGRAAGETVAAIGQALAASATAGRDDFELAGPADGGAA